MDGRYKRLLGNSAWTFIGNAGSKLISFLLLPFYTKWLGTEGYGFSDLITTYASLFGGIITLCLSDAILIFVKDKIKEEQKSYFSSAISTTLCLLLIWSLLLLLLRSYGNKSDSFILENVGYIMGMIVTNFLQTCTQQMALAINKIKVYSFSGLVLCITIFVFSRIFIPIYGVTGYVLAMLLANVATSLFTIVLASEWHFLALSTTRIRRIKELLYYSIPLIPNTIMWWLVSALNRPLMEETWGFSAVGIFSVAQKFPAIITMLFSIFSVSWTVSVIEEYGKPRFDEFYKKVFRITFGGLVVCSLILMVFSKIIIQLLTATEFHASYKYMVILIIGAFFSCLSAFCGTSFGVVKKSKYFFYSSLWGAIAAVILNYILIPRFEIWGAALAVAISFLVTALARYIYSFKFVKANLLTLMILYSLLLVITALFILWIDSLVFQCIEVVLCLSVIFYIEKNNFFSFKEMIISRFNK